MYRRWLSSLKKGQLVAGNTKAWLGTSNVKEISFSDHTHTDYAAANHTHSGYASSSHTHSQYALTSHTHSKYALTNHIHSDYITTGQLQTYLDELGIVGNTKTVTITTSNLSWSGNSSGDFNSSYNIGSVCGFIPSAVTMYSSGFTFKVNTSVGIFTVTISQDLALPQTYLFSNDISVYTVRLNVKLSDNGTITFSVNQMKDGRYEDNVFTINSVSPVNITLLCLRT